MVRIPPRPLYRQRKCPVCYSTGICVGPRTGLEKNLFSLPRIEPRFLSHSACVLVTTRNKIIGLLISSKLYYESSSFCKKWHCISIKTINHLTLLTVLFFLQYRSLTKKIQCVEDAQNYLMLKQRVRTLSLCFVSLHIFC